MSCKLCKRLRGQTVLHGYGNICDLDPRLPQNVIAAHFKRENPRYIGIVWEAIANGAVRALEQAGFTLTAKYPAVPEFPAMPCTNEVSSGVVGDQGLNGVDEKGGPSDGR